MPRWRDKFRHSPGTGRLDTESRVIVPSAAPSRLGVSYAAVVGGIALVLLIVYLRSPQRDEINALVDPIEQFVGSATADFGKLESEIASNALDRRQLRDRMQQAKAKRQALQKLHQELVINANKLSDLTKRLDKLSNLKLGE
jgi:hypothetical protein